jgi:hypothetical protein
MAFDAFRSAKTKDYWTYLEDNYKEVSTWPTWMRGEPSSNQNSKVKDPASEEATKPNDYPVSSLRKT